MLKRLVFVFYTALQPVIAVKIKDDAALVEPMMAFGEVCLHDETEILFLCLHLEYRGVVVPEMVIGALPKVGAWFCDHLYGVILDGATLWLPCPLEVVDIQFHNVLVLYNVLLMFTVFFACTCRKQ